MERYAPLLVGLSQFRSSLLFLGLFVAACCWTLFSFRDDISQQISRIAVERVNLDLQPCGWTLQIGSTQMVSTTALVVSNISLLPPGSDEPGISIESLVIDFSNRWAAGEAAIPDVQSLVVDQSMILVHTKNLNPDDLRRLSERVRELQLRPDRSPEFLIRDSTCQILGEPDMPHLELRKVNLRTIEEDKQSSTICDCESDFFHHGAVRFLHPTAERPWLCESQIDQVSLDDSALEIARELGIGGVDQISHLGGQFNLNFRAGPDEQGQMFYEVTGRGQRVNVLHKQIATPISNGTFDFEVRNDILKLTNIRASLGGGDCRATYSQQGLLSRQDFEFQGQLDNLNVTPQLGEVLNEQGRKFFADFSPTGLVSVRFHIGETNKTPFRSIRANVHDLAVTYVKFPYTLEHFVGNFSFIDNRCELDVQSLVGAEILTLKGFVQNPGPRAVMDIQFECPGNLPFDDKLFRAIKTYPNIYKQVLAMKPRGQVSVEGRIQKTDPQLPVNLNYTIALDQCLVRHDSFDYPFKNVSGKVVVQGQQVSFQDVLGENLNSKVTCNGNWNPQDGLKLRFWCQNVSLDEQLRLAVPEMVKHVWHDLLPSGKIPLVRVDLTHTPNSDAPQVNLQIDSRSDKQSAESSLAVKPIAFPYEIGNIEALITFENNKIKIADFHGAHGRTWVTCRGEGDYSPTGWTLQLTDLLTGAIPVNQDFLSALPVGLQCPLEQLNFQGSFNLSGSMRLSGGHQSEQGLAPNFNSASEVARVSFVAPVEATRERPPPSMSWDLRLDVDRGEMYVGLEVADLHGQIRLIGAFDGTRAYSEGEIAIESMTVLNTQITNVKGPIWIDQDHVGVGFFATPLGSKPNPLSLSGDVFGGQIEFDGQTWHDERQKFYLQTTVSNVSLRSAAANFAPAMESIDGRSQLALRLSGDSGAIDSLQGEGLIKMYNARIYELPVLLATLKQLRNFNEDKSAFDSGSIDFGIKGKVISISRIELNGEPISLIGNGQIDLDQNVELNFYSIVGRNRFEIPIISDLYKASSQQIMWINVGGTLRSPRTSQEILPGVNEGLRELFNQK